MVASTFRHVVKTYDEARELFQKRGKRSGRVILGYQTTLERRGDCYAVRHHATDIVTYRPDGTVRLTSGGWYSATTKDRLSTFSPVYVTQYKFEWYVAPPGSFDRVPYFDGMVIG